MPQRTDLSQRPEGLGPLVFLSKASLPSKLLPKIRSFVSLTCQAPYVQRLTKKCGPIVISISMSSCFEKKMASLESNLARMTLFFLHPGSYLTKIPRLFC